MGLHLDLHNFKIRNNSNTSYRSIEELIFLRLQLDWNIMYDPCLWEVPMAVDDHKIIIHLSSRSQSVLRLSKITRKAHPPKGKEVERITTVSNE